jgi:hypothetical protein
MDPMLEYVPVPPLAAGAAFGSVSQAPLQPSV